MIPFDETIELLKKADNPQAKICSNAAYWIPLKWLYCEMVKNKDLVPLADLETKEKQRLWKLTIKLRPDKSEEWIRKSFCQAIYVYEKIRND